MAPSGTFPSTLTLNDNTAAAPSGDGKAAAPPANNTAAASTQPVATTIKTAASRRTRSGKITLEKQATAEKKKRSPANILKLTVHPGRLGLTFSIDTEGAKITAIHPTCTFKGWLTIGDRIIAIDGNQIKKLVDLTVGKERTREFCFVKNTTVSAENVKLRAQLSQKLLKEEAKSRIREEETCNEANDKVRTLDGRLAFLLNRRPQTDEEARSVQQEEIKKMESQLQSITQRCETLQTKLTQAEDSARDANEKLQQSNKQRKDTKIMKQQSMEGGNAGTNAVKVKARVTSSAQSSTIVEKTPATASTATASSAKFNIDEHRNQPVAGPPTLQRVYPRKQTFRYLTEMRANGTDRDAEHRRQEILTELLQWDKQNGINTEAKMGSWRYQLLCIPLSRKNTSNKREMDNQYFRKYNNATKVFDKFIDAWAKNCDGTQEDAANMILFHLANRFPQCYVTNFQMATKKHEKMVGPPPVDLPPDFLSYDGANDIKWNTRYAELVKYHEENGDCKVMLNGPLGRWVSRQRSAKTQTSKILTDKRVELLDNLGFLWSGFPKGRAKAIKGGDPRQNRAIAAKLTYPDLSIRECLHLGGFKNDELDVIKDQKHTWRTLYVEHKDTIRKKIDNYQNARLSGARLETEKLTNILNGEEEDRFVQVFGECSSLLLEFLAAAEERVRNGIEVDKPRRNGSKKRKNEDVDMLSDDEEEMPARKQPHVDYDGAEQPTDDEDS